MPNGTLDRWYVSGPLGIGTTFDEQTDAHSAANIQWPSLGSLLRHSGPETLNLLDARAAGLNQGANLNWWALNAANKAVRLGLISARLSATADGAAAGYLAFHTKPSSSDVRESLRITDTGSVGIGTATPQSRLQVKSLTAIDEGPSAGGAWANIGSNAYYDGAWKRIDATKPGVNLHMNGEGGGQEFRFLRTETSGNSRNIAVLGTSVSFITEGNVGIGTSAPTRARLEVAGKVSATVASLGQGDTGISFTASWPGVGFNGYYGAGWRAMAAGYTGVIHLDPGAGAFRFYTGTSAAAPDQAVTMTERFTVDTAGNVGIGTSAPQGRLHIANGDLRLDGGHTISAGGRLHISGDEILYLLNRSGVIVSRAWGGSGDLTVESRIGVNGQSPVPRTGGWAGGIHTWDLEVEGSAWCRTGWASGARDMAENFEAEVALEAGDVVSFHPEDDTVMRSAMPNDARICGVVSTDPGVLLNVDPDRHDHKVRVPVALCGRVPCHVVDENGPIRRGDLLTSSSVPGYAMRAEPMDLGGEAVYRAGTIVGKALTSHRQGGGMIDIFVSPS
jgi:hypothetical protein